MNKRSPTAHAVRPTALDQASRDAPRPVDPDAARVRRAALVPLGALALVALGACGADDASTNDPGARPSPGEAASPIASIPPQGPQAGDPSEDIYDGVPLDDGFLTFDEALQLAATGQVVEIPPSAPGAPAAPAAPGASDGGAGDTGGSGEPLPSLGAGTPAPGGGDGSADGDGAGGGTGDGAEGGAGDGTDGGAMAGGDGAPDTPDGPDDGGGDGSPPAGPAPDAVGDSTIGRRFVASTTEGFAGEVLEDGSVKVEWAEDRSARGYNTYRDAEYVTTVFDTEWVDRDAHDGDFYYEIEAFDIADNFTRIATGLTVPVRGSGKPDPTPDERGTPDIDDYELVFAEEFEGDSLDLDTWNTSYLWGDDLVINQEEQHYVDIENEPDFGFDPFDVSDGTLKIMSVPTPPELADEANGQPYLSGVITSYDAFQFTYGYAEARAKTPYGQGLWSAFWLLNAFYGDDDPEIDIMEHIGDDQDVVYHTYHYYEDPETLRSTESLPVPGVDYVGGFHTYAVDWRPGLLIFYVDGRETHRISDPRVSNQDMYIIANTALGGWWPGSPDDTTEFPARYELDWIRVYRKATPYADAPFSDDTPSSVPMADAVPGTSPNHRPPLELFPNGYPTR